MALQKQYPEDFERLWAVYPKWPTGRSKKEPSYKAFAKAKKDLQFTQDDIAFIEKEIKDRVRDCETWQKGNKFGAEMFATFFNQHRWNEPYQRAKGGYGKDGIKPQGMFLSDEENSRLFWQAAASRGEEVPEKYRHFIEH